MVVYDGQLLIPETSLTPNLDEFGIRSKAEDLGAGIPPKFLYSVMTIPNIIGEDTDDVTEWICLCTQRGYTTT